ncbi:hypothetical protein GCM10022221_35140 [Actinocorallia aurea]
MIQRLAFTIPPMPGQFEHAVPLLLLAPDTLGDLFDVTLPRGLHHAGHTIAAQPADAAPWTVAVDDAWLGAAEEYGGPDGPRAKVVIVLEPVDGVTAQDAQAREIAAHLPASVPPWALAVLAQRLRAALRDVPVTSVPALCRAPLTPTGLPFWAEDLIEPLPEPLS